MGKSCFSNRALVKASFEAPKNAFDLRPPKLKSESKKRQKVFGDSQKGGFPKNKNRNKGTFGTKPERTRVHSEQNRNEGTFACSPGTKTGTRVHSPKPPFYDLRLRNPGFRKRKPRVFINRHPPSRPPKTPSRSLKTPLQDP